MIETLWHNFFFLVFVKQCMEAFNQLCLFWDWSNFTCRSLICLMLRGRESLILVTLLEHLMSSIPMFLRKTRLIVSHGYDVFWPSIVKCSTVVFHSAMHILTVSYIWLLWKLIFRFILQFHLSSMIWIIQAILNDKRYVGGLKFFLFIPVNASSGPFCFSAMVIQIVGWENHYI